MHAYKVQQQRHHFLSLFFFEAFAAGFAAAEDAAASFFTTGAGAVAFAVFIAALPCAFLLISLALGSKYSRKRSSPSASSFEGDEDGLAEEGGWNQ